MSRLPTVSRRVMISNPLSLNFTLCLYLPPIARIIPSLKWHLEPSLGSLLLFHSLSFPSLHSLNCNSNHILCILNVLVHPVRENDGVIEDGLFPNLNLCRRAIPYTHK